MIKHLPSGKVLLLCALILTACNGSSQEWTWINGANTVNVFGSYGVQNLSSSSNQPGGREAAGIWTDNSGNLWMFGGNGNAIVSSGKLSDLWKWNPVTKEWVWVKGSTFINQAGVYGSKGSPGSLNAPGGRSNPVTWTDNSGYLWMFGGNGLDAFGTTNELNDLWRYNIATGEWTWLSGSNTAFQNGIYGTLGVASSTNCPGSRRLAASWKDNSGNLWLFGGYGLPETGGTVSNLNDLWKYDIGADTWTWVSGSNTIDQTGVYGTKGAPAAANIPGSRYGSVAWKDASDNLYLFGGNGNGSASQGFLNDVWKFNITLGQWTWAKGSDLINQLSVLGTPTQFAFNNNPGGRQQSAFWTDASGNLYIHGGYGISLAGSQQLNDVWKFENNSSQWTFIRGAINQVAGNYGTPGVTATSNDPGSGNSRMSWKDGSGNFWLFGGSAYDVNANFGYLSDLWKMNPCLPAAPINITNFGNQNVCTGSVATLTAVSGFNPVTWYTSPTGTTTIATGSVYTTPNLITGTTSTTFTYYVSATNTCGISAARTPIVAGAFSVYPVVTTGETYTQSMYIGNLQTMVSNWTPALFNFADPLPAGAIITGIDLTYTGKDQGTGGSGAPADLYVADVRVASTALTHGWVAYNTTFTGPLSDYVYGGTNTFRFNFWGYPAWQGFLTNVNLVFRYQTKTPLPVTACQNSSLTFKGYGAVTYTWSDGATDDIPHALTTTQIYTVTGANAYGCTNSATLQVNVTPAPTLAITGSTDVCAGSSVTQVASITGTSHTFSWSTGSTAMNVTLNPTISTLYSAIVTNTLTGCFHEVLRKVNVNSVPAVSMAVTSGTICSGQTTSLAVNTNGSAYALNFDGVDDYVETNVMITELATADFCIEAWVKTTGVSEAIVICANTNGTWDAGEKCFYLDALGVPNFVGYSNNYIVGNVPVNDGLWHHVAVVWDYVSGTSGTGYIYVDGVNHTSNFTYAANINTVGTFKIGYTNSNAYVPEAPNNFSGAIDEVRIWNTIRTGSQISTNMNNCLNGNEGGLAAYYNFEDGPGYSTLADKGNSDYHGTLANMNTATAWVNGRSNCAKTYSAYSWMPGALTGTAISVAPGTTTIYTVSVTDNLSCTGSVSKTITVNPSPTITVNSGSICYGSSYTIAPTGADTYTFLTGAAVISPTTTSSYSVTGTSSLNCLSTNTAVSTITVNALPTISVNSGTLCSGDSFSMTPAGVSTYTFLSGASVVNPVTSTSYSVVGASPYGCVSSNTAVASLTVHPLPVISINSGTICVGNPFTVTPSGASTYTFLNGSAVVSPASSTDYSVVGSSSLGCISSNTAIASVLVNPSPTVIVNSGAICAGNSFTITPSGANTYTFLTGNTVVSPATTTSYSITGTSSFGCQTDSPSLSTVTVNPLPALTIGGLNAVCSGSAITETVSGADTYLWSTGSTATLISVNPTVPTSYNVSGTITATGCYNSATKFITIGTPPVINVNSGNVCSGAAFTMLPNGASTYTFSDGTSTVPATVSPTTNTSYFVTGTSSLGCISLYPAISNVIITPAPVITVNSGGVCAGNVFTMTPTGASTYTYSNGSPTTSPTANTDYTVTGTNVLGCVSIVPAIAHVTLNPVPVISIANASVCSGSGFSITPSGAATYTIVSNTGPSSAWVSPLANADYSITGTSALGCVSSNTAILTLSAVPLPIISVNSSTVCTGSVFIMMPSGASSYTYSSGASTVIPLSNTSYSVTGTSSLGCVSAGAAVASVTLVATPVVTVNSGVICAGEVFTMIPSGAVSYTYSSLSATAAPATNTFYTVEGTSTQGCVSSNLAIANVVVNPAPSLSVLGNSVICAGENTNLMATGATSYTWNGSAVGPVQNFSPAASTIYTVTGINSDNCVSTATAPVTVNPLPVLVLNSGTICPASTFVIVPAGAVTYTFSGGSNSVSPSVTTSYSVTGTDANGCVSNIPAVTTVTVVNTIILSVGGTTVLCAGNAATLSVNGASSYTWNTGELTNTIAPTPSVNSTYTVMGSTGTCADTAFISVQVNQLPVMLVNSSSSVMCLGENITLTSSGASTYVWDDGETTAVVILSPTLTTSYTVTGTDTNGCSNKATFTQTVAECLGVKSSAYASAFINLYPNPNAGEFTVEAPQQTGMVILNALGEVIQEKQLAEGKNKVLLEDQAKGIYFIEFKNKTQSKIIKVIKQ